MQIPKKQRKVKTTVITDEHLDKFCTYLNDGNSVGLSIKLAGMQQYDFYYLGCNTIPKVAQAMEKYKAVFVNKKRRWS